jgi:hypothetical protein
MRAISPAGMRTIGNAPPLHALQFTRNITIRKYYPYIRHGQSLRKLVLADAAHYIASPAGKDIRAQPHAPLRWKLK